MKLRRLLLVPVALVALDMLLWFTVFRRRAKQWGVAREELERAMPGDELVPDANYHCMQAVTVNAPPDCIYPWLLQMGEGRDGLYSWDFLDRLFGILSHESAKEIHAEWQNLEVGDVIPVKHGPPFPVAILEPNHAFVLASGEIGYTWQTVMYPQPDGTTRLVTRNLAKWGATGLKSRVMMAWLDPATFIMVHRWLRVLKQRAEQLYAERLAAGEEQVTAPAEAGSESVSAGAA